MKPWKVILVGAACAACCVAPLAALATGATSMAAAGAATLACADRPAALAAVLAGLGFAATATAGWRGRARRRAAATPSCEGCCNVRRA